MRHVFNVNALTKHLLRQYFVIYIERSNVSPYKKKYVNEVASLFYIVNTTL
jgi:hypothetical protein